MAPKASNLILIISIILFSYANTISAFNITRLLNNHPEFSTFNDLLTRTGVAAAINGRSTITVLVVANSAAGSISGIPPSTLKNVLATHVILDYYDTTKFGDLSKNATQLTNLYQTTGVAGPAAGFTKLTASGGDVIFSSAAKGAPQDSKMVKSVAAQPYNISVIQISQPIVTPGLDQNAPISPSSSPVAAPPTPVAAPPPKKEAAAPAPDAAEGPADDEAADAPEAEGPAGTEAPTPAPAPGPEADVAADEAPAKLAPPPKGAGARVTVGGAVLLGLVSLAL